MGDSEVGNRIKKTNLGKTGGPGRGMKPKQEKTLSIALREIGYRDIFVSGQNL